MGKSVELMQKGNKGMNKIIFIGFIALLVSCGKKDKIKFTGDMFFSDTIYERVWFNNLVEEKPEYHVELYISNVGDTIQNQYVQYKNGVIDTLKSEFYDLEVLYTNEAHIYKGILTLHSRFDNLQINEKNRRRLQLMYDEFGDSISIGSVISESSNRLEFEFRNVISEHLTGVLIQDVFRDTIIDGDNMVNYSETRILVDTRDITDNISIYSHRFLEEKRVNKNRGNSNN